MEHKDFMRLYNALAQTDFEIRAVSIFYEGRSEGFKKLEDTGVVKQDKNFLDFSLDYVKMQVINQSTFSEPNLHSLNELFFDTNKGYFPVCMGITGAKLIETTLETKEILRAVGIKEEKTELAFLLAEDDEVFMSGYIPNTDHKYFPADILRSGFQFLFSDKRNTEIIFECHPVFKDYEAAFSEASSRAAFYLPLGNLRDISLSMSGPRAIDKLVSALLMKSDYIEYETMLRQKYQTKQEEIQKYIRTGQNR